MQTAQVQISRWGNSLAIRIPQNFVKSLRLNESSKLIVELKEDKMILEKEEETLESLCAKMSPENLNIERAFESARGQEW